jgi:hypothetical protein
MNRISLSWECVEGVSHSVPMTPGKERRQVKWESEGGNAVFEALEGFGYAPSPYNCDVTEWTREEQCALYGIFDWFAEVVVWAGRFPAISDMGEEEWLKAADETFRIMAALTPLWVDKLSETANKINVVDEAEAP